MLFEHDPAYSITINKGLTAVTPLRPDEVQVTVVDDGELALLAEVM
jgi:hypothetical protein